MDADVVVIGAGLSGLQAARSLVDTGIKTIVLEARSRVGGKTLSVANKDNAGIADLGAEWLNDTTHPHLYQLARSLGLEFSDVKISGEAVLQDLDGHRVRHVYGSQAPLPNGEDKTVQSMRETFHEEYSKIDLAAAHECLHDEVSLEEFVRQRGGGPSTLATVAVWTKVMLGCEPCEISAAYFLVYCRSQGGLMKMRSGPSEGKYVTIKTGTQSVAQGLASSLPKNSVQLDTAATKIVQKEGQIDVHTADGRTFRAREVIVALATPLYARIIFDPPLPEKKAALVSSTKLGQYTKVLVTYRRPWWRDDGLCGASQSLISFAAATRDTSDDDASMYRLTGFIAGRDATRFAALSQEERRTAILGQFATVFGNDEAKDPSDYVEMQWTSEEWSQGCPCPFMPPGILSSLGSHLEESHKHVHFVGTETAQDWKGYMEGALTSGLRGAQEVLEALK